MIYRCVYNYVYYSVQHLNKFCSCYEKCLKVVIRYPEFGSAIAVLLDLKLITEFQYCCSGA